MACQYPGNRTQWCAILLSLSPITYFSNHHKLSIIQNSSFENPLKSDNIVMETVF